MGKRKRLDILTVHRLKKVMCELNEILENVNLKKTDRWDLEQVSVMIKDMLKND